MERLKSAIKGFFEWGAETEEMFETEIMPLLKEGFIIVRASHYTGSRKTFSDKIKSRPTDFLIIYIPLRLVIAAVEVTAGSKGWSYEMSHQIDIDEPKLAEMDMYNAGFVVERIYVGEPHFIWATREDIRKYPADGLTTRHTEMKIWKKNLDTLVKAFEELAEKEEKIALL